MAESEDIKPADQKITISITNASGGGATKLRVKKGAKAGKIFDSVSVGLLGRQEVLRGGRRRWRSRSLRWRCCHCHYRCRCRCEPPPPLSLSQPRYLTLPALYRST